MNHSLAGFHDDHVLSENMQIIIGSYEPVAVMLSVAIAILASYAALEFANRMGGEDNQRRNLWLLLGSVTMGVGIWSMHFIGMLAYQLPLPVQYDPTTTLFSIVPSGLASGVAFYVIGRQRVSELALAGASLFMGMAISSMHYIGMLAMRMPAGTIYDPFLFMLSIFIGIAASWGALKLAIRLHDQDTPPEWQKQTSALLMGSAISGMHYCGMAAMQVYEAPIVAFSDAGSIVLADHVWLFVLMALLFPLLMAMQATRDRLSIEGLSLTAKITLMSSLFVMLAAAGVGLLAYNIIRDLEINDEVTQLQLGVKQKIERLDRIVVRLKQDVRHLHRHPQVEAVLDPLRHLNESTDSNSIQLSELNRMAVVFRELLYSRPDYQQIRLLAANEDGRELLRLERRGGEIIAVDPEALQSKADEPYFQELLTWKSDYIYLSEVSLNRENGVITSPHTPMLRGGVPVRSLDGQLLAFLLINVNLSPLFQEFIVIESPDDADYITNERGEILVFREPLHRSTNGEVRELLYNRYPVLQRAYAEERLFDAFHFENEDNVVNLHKLFYDRANPQRFVAIAEVLPTVEIERRIQPVLNRLIMTTLLFTVIAAWLVVSLVRMLVRPLNRITEASAQLAAGKPLPVLDFKRSDEIGALARTFQHMVERVISRERALAESEELTRKVIQSAGDGIVIINEKGVIQSVNEAAMAIFGYKQEEMEGNNVSKLMPEPHRSNHNGYLERYMQSGVSDAIGSMRELQGQRQNGELFPLELVTTEVIHGSGRLFVGMVRDISNRKKEEQELRLASQVMESSLESIVITDAGHNICAVNPAFTEITGYSAEEVIGHNPKMFSSGRQDKDFYQQMWADISQEGSWQGEIWDRRKNGETYPKWMSITGLKDSNGDITHYVSIASDITERKLSERRLEQLAHYDALTGLPNRMLLQDRLHHGINLCKRSHSHLALLFLDLDRFKAVNDNYGHEVGDQLLTAVAERLQGGIRESDTLARQGGDEFVIMLSEVHEPSDAGKVAEHLIESLQAPFHIDGKECFIGVSVGIAIYPDDGDTPDELARKADAAMYRAKETGGDSYSLYDQLIGEQTRRRLQVENSLRYAVTKNELELHYQPLVSLQTGKVVAVESLLRWQHAELGDISPAEFIPLAEDAGLINNIGHWGITQACEQFRRWCEQGVKLERLAVNLSPRCLLQPGLPEYIETLLKDNHIPASALELELTETTVMEYSGQAARFFETIENMGVRLAIDDFGTGYSSLAHIKQLPIHVLKIDRSFVRDIGLDSNDREIIRGVTALAHGLGLEVVAEGVETMQQFEFLKSLDCDLLQGWLYMPAVSGEEISRLFAHDMLLLPSAPE